MTIKLTSLDLNFILTQIQQAEAGQNPVNPLLSFGLREIAGTNNNLTAGGSKFGSSFQTFPSTTDPLFQNAQGGTSYIQTNGLVIDSQPRQISQLIASQGIKILGAGPDGIKGTADDVVQTNPAALAAQNRDLGLLGPGYQNTTLPGPDGIYGTADDTGTTFAGPDGVLGTADDITTKGNQATPTNASNSSSTIPGLAQSLFLPNVTPDNGLSAPTNTFFTIFGQFFDHGLDLIDKGGNGQVFISLKPDDPLFVAGSNTNFMVLDRATDLPGPDGKLGTADDVHQGTNSITPFVDQGQTYGSDPSHDAYLRQYMIGSDGKLHSSGKLLSDGTAASGVAGSAPHTTLANWADLKANAATFLGIKITDLNVNAIPMLATDAFGNLILGANGLAQLVVTFADGKQGLVAGDLTNPTATSGTAVEVPGGLPVSYTAITTGAGFIDDKAFFADPVDAQSGRFLQSENTTDPNAIPTPQQYNNALLDQHKVAGDGRLNENMGLTAIQQIFHAEHDRLVAQIEATTQTNLNNGDTSFAGNWVLPGVVLTPGVAIAANQWDGERIFQAAKFGTETEYQHIVFEEFARFVAPAIHVAGGVNVHIDPAITSEFANVVFRFGHSMLDENLNIYQLGPDGKPVLGANGQPVMTQEGLIDAFTNPLKFASDPNMTADLVMGMTGQVGSEMDEFVTGALQNNLDGLPLDLPALNIARGRDAGVAPMNLVRAQLFSQSHEVQLKPYTSWVDFGTQLKHIESLVNFIAAYGTDSSIVNATTNAAKVAAAQALITNGTLGSATFDINAFNFMNSTGADANNKLNPLAVHDSAGKPAVWGTGSITGVDNIDLWIGGLAEKQSLFGGTLGSTFEFIFRTQMEALQDADRLYYLPRIEGTSYEESLQDSSLAQLVHSDTDIAHPAGNIFQTPEYTIEASTYFTVNPDGSLTAKDPLDANHTWLTNPQTGKVLVNINPDGTLQFVGDNNFLGNDIVMGGTAGNDKMTAGPSDGDTLWGDAGNDTLDGGGGADFLFGGDGNDTLQGGQGADTLHGDAGNDTIFGGNDLDTIFGGDGNDYVEGGRGDDSILGGLGNDILIGNEGFDTLIGNEGDDWLESRGGQGDIMFGDSGAPTGQQPLYSGNDVMVGGVAGGDKMKGFAGDDIMLGHGSFTKFDGGLGFDWGSYELATQAVDEDMNRKEFVAANGAVDNIRDVWIHTEGASGSAFNDIILGDNATKLLTTKDELDNVNLISGLPSFFDPGVVSFSGGNILLGGAGSDAITGGGGNDVIDGDAFLHVGLTSQTAGATILRQIHFDPNGNTYDPKTAVTTANNGVTTLVTPGGGHQNAANVDIAVYNGPLSNYNVALFDPDGEGFLTIQQTGTTPIVGANPQGLLGVNDDTDRIRNIERLQFTDGTIAIDKYGNEISSSFARTTATSFPDYATLYAPFYDAVPFGTPTIAETTPGGAVIDATAATGTVTVGNTLAASITAISDFDGINPGTMKFQWQSNDVVTGAWVDIAGATTATFNPTVFQIGLLGVRVKTSYVDGKGYTEQLTSDPTAVVSLPATTNTAPTLVTAQQFNGISNTTAVLGAAFDYFSPFTAIFTDAQTAANALTYTAVLSDGSALINAGLQFSFNPTTGAGEFSTLPGVVLSTTGEIGVRVVAADPQGLAVTSTFVITVAPPNTAPIAVDDGYTTPENVGLTAVPSTSVLSNDTDPNGDTFTAALVTGPTNGTLRFNPDGTFVYIPNLNFLGADSFTYQDTDPAGAVSNIATATISVVNLGTVTIAPTSPATTNSVTETFTQGLLIPVPGSITIAWDTSLDGVTFTSTGATAAAFLPAVTDAAGVFLRATVSFVNAGVTIPVASDPVHYISDGVLGGVAGHTMAGIAGNNIIFANAGDDVITAGTGPVLAYGGDGNDSFVATVGDGIATFDGQAGTDTYDLSTTSAAAAVSLTVGTATSTQTGNATLISVENVVGSSGNDHISGNALDNVLTGGAGNDTIDGGGAGNDTFVATVGDGNDSYAGGGGIDTYDLSATAAGATVNLGLGTATGLDTGTDTLVGIENVIGGAGNDRFVAAIGDGNNSYIGGLGTDTYDLSATAAAATVNLATGVSASTDTGSDKLAGIENVVGSSGADTITGDGNANVITGGAGNDTLVGGAGNDTFVATLGDGNDKYDGGSGTDTYDLSATTLGVTANLSQGTASGAEIGSDTFTFVSNGVSTLENVTGGTGNDTITGDAQNNVLIGGAGNDTLSGGAGADTMTGGIGNDSYFVENVGDVVNEAVSQGSDTVFASVNYALTAGSEIEFLRANAGATGLSLTGNALANGIVGGAGADVLDGGGGGDKFTGGAGNDVFKFSAVGFGADTINDFAPGVVVGSQDLIDISALGIKASQFGTLNVLTVVGASGGSALITVNGGGATGGTILLSSVNQNNISAADFKFAPP